MNIPEDEFIRLEEQMNQEHVSYDRGMLIMKKKLWEIGARYNFGGDEVFKQLISWKIGKTI